MAFDSFPFSRTCQRYFQAWQVQANEFSYFKETENMSLPVSSKKPQCT